MPSGFLGGGIGPMALKRRRAAVANGLLNNLIAYWPLNEAGDANNALDLHSNALTLTQVASPGSAAGKVYVGARTFDGASQYFSRASEAALQTGDVDFTIAAWMYLTSKPAANCAVVSKYNPNTNNREYLVFWQTATDKMRFAISSNGTPPGYVDIAGTTPMLNSWLFVCAWHDASANTINIQMDNGTPNSAAHSSGVFGGSAGFLIGAISNPNFYFPGRIGPVAMWKSAPGGGGVLTAAQRTALWANGNGLPYAQFTT